MPLVEITVPAGLLTGPTKQTLINDLTSAVLKAEGVPDSPRARSLTWIFLNEAPKGSWAIACEPPSDLRFLVRVTVPVGALSVARKRRMGLDIYKLLSKTSGKQLGTDEAWIIVVEVPQGNWTAAGKVIQLQDLTTFMGIKIPPKPTDT